MEYNLFQNNSTDCSNSYQNNSIDNSYQNNSTDKNYQNCFDKEHKNNFLIKKNLKNINMITILQNKINELNNKFEFYKKHENNLTNIDLNIVNNSIEIIDDLIIIFTKNMISKGQFNRNNNNKYIEFEF